MSKVEIRKATESDVPELLLLYAQLDERGRKTLPLDAATEIFRRIAADPNHTIHVAMLDGALVGTFAVLFMENLAHRGAPSAIVESVVVDEKRRGDGIGKAMMAFAMQTAEARGCYKLALSSNLRREEAHEFYRSIGFEQHGLSFQVKLQQDGTRTR